MMSTEFQPILNTATSFTGNSKLPDSLSRKQLSPEFSQIMIREDLLRRMRDNEIREEGREERL